MSLLPHDEDWELSPENAHPEAQALMTEAWYWDCTNDYSPFGNDSGADTLAFYSQEVANDPTLTGAEFLNSLLESWEMDPCWDATSNESVEEIMASEPYGIGIANDAAIAVAFAQILLFGRVEEASRHTALKAISRAALPVLLACGAHPEERTEPLAVMRAHLNQTATR